MLSVGGRAGDGVHVVGAGPQVSLASVMHPGAIEAGAVAGLQAIARPEAREAEWVSEGGAGPGSDREVTDWRVKGCPTSSWVSTCTANT